MTLNIESKDQSLWLVKIPQFIAEKWATLSNDEILGSLTVKVAGQTKQLHVDLSNTNTIDGSTLPTKFTLEEISQQSTGDEFYALSATVDEQNDEEPVFSMDGKITKNLILKPQNNDEYHEFIRERNAKAKIKWRKETILADANELQRSALQPQILDFMQVDATERKRKLNASEKKQTTFSSLKEAAASEKETAAYIKSKIFQAFTLNEKQSFKDILSVCVAGADAAGVSIRDDEVKEMLKEFARYHAKGLAKTFWELKPEYRDHSVAKKVENG